MPDEQTVQFTNGRAVNDEGDIHIEGIGVVPTVLVPVDQDTLFSDGDPILDAAVAELDAATAVEIIDGGPIAIGDTVNGDLAVNTRVQYTLETFTGDSFGVVFGDESGQFDTYLRIYDAEGTLLPETTMRLRVRSIRPSMILSVPRMTLVIEVATYEDTGEGANSLQVVASDAPPAGGSAAPTDASTPPTEVAETTAP